MFNSIETNLVCIAILLVLLLNVKKQSKVSISRHKYFLMLLLLNILILVVFGLKDLFEGYSQVPYRIAFTILNVIYYIFVSIIISMWILYVNHFVNDNKKYIKALLSFIIPFILLNTVLALLSPFSGLLFYIDQAGYAHASQYYQLILGLSYLMMISSIVFIIYHRNIVPKNDIKALLLFTLAPMISASLQIFYQELNLLWPSVTVSIVIIYVSIQAQLISTDPLTGVYNRREYDKYLEVLNQKNLKNNISAIMIDINDFKLINDERSHHHGDIALREIGDILQRSIRKNDFIARIGGDEFCVIIESEHDQILFEIVSRINFNINQYNKNKEEDIPITLSMGYGVYNPKYHQTLQEFLEYLDKKMYQDKIKNKPDLSFSN